MCWGRRRIPWGSYGKVSIQWQQHWLQDRKKFAKVRKDSSWEKVENPIVCTLLWPLENYQKKLQKKAQQRSLFFRKINGGNEIPAMLKLSTKKFQYPSRIRCLLFTSQSTIVMLCCSPSSKLLYFTIRGQPKAFRLCVCIPFYNYTYIMPMNVLQEWTKTVMTTRVTVIRQAHP